MKKKLIALGVAGALAAPLIASAQGTHVTIFGRIQAEYATVDIDGRGAQTGILDDAAQSRWGLQVAEDLGMGFRAMGRAEFGFNPGAGTTQTSREQWVGLGSNQWGEVKFGRVQSPFKDFAGGHTIDPFAYTSLHANGSGGLMVASENGLGSGDNSFANSSARYDSPVVEGFQMSALLMAGDAKKLDPTRNPSGFGGNTSNSGGEDGEWDFQVAGKYSGQFDALGVNIFGGYSRDNVSDQMKGTFGVKDDEEIWRGGALLSFADLRVRGQYEWVNNANPFGGAASCTQAAAFGTFNPALPSQSTDGGRGQCNSAMNANGDGYLWFAGIDYTIGNTMLIAQGGMGHANNTGLLQSKDVENITAGVIHNLSRRSSLFGGYQRVWVKDKNLAAIGQDADRNVYTVGLRHDF